jgi:hypothetical protein
VATIRVRRSFVDRRRHQRYDIDGDLIATLTSAHVLRLANVGSHGALVETFAPLPVHSLYEGRLILGSDEFDVRFRVLHVRTADSPAQYVMGVEFLEPSPRAIDRIEAWLASEERAGDSAEHYSEKRRSGRVSRGDCHLRFQVRLPVMMRDISGGGALLDVPVTMPADTQAHLRTMLRGRRFDTDLAIGRIEPDARAGGPASRLGVRFTAMDEDSRDALTDFLAIATERDD